MSEQQTESTQSEGSTTSGKKGGRGKKQPAKGRSYQAGKSCIQLGEKHNYKETPSGKSMRCTKCGSTRWLGKTKKATKKGKKSAKRPEESSENPEENANPEE